MKHAKYIVLAVFALGVLASAVVVSAQGSMPPQGTPPAGQSPRGTPPGGQPPQERPGQGQPPQGNQFMPGDWAGVVQAVTSSSLTVLRPNNETFTAIISSTTKIELMVSQSTGTVSDIQVGNNVTIDGRKNTDGSVAAVRILVEPGGTRAAGAVSAISGTTITLTTQKEMVTVVTTTSTKFVKGKDAGTLSDVTKGTFVMAYGAKQSDGSISATYIIVNTAPGMQGQGQPPQEQGQPTRNQTPPPQQTRNQTPPPQATRNQTPPPQLARAQTPVPPSGQGSRPTPATYDAAQSNSDSPVAQGANPLDQFVQWLLGLFK